MSSYNFKQGDKIGTPGFVRGMHDMHEKKKVRWTRRKSSTIFIPLAEDGFK